MNQAVGHVRLLHSHFWLLDASRGVGRDDCPILSHALSYIYESGNLGETYVATRAVGIRPHFVNDCVGLTA